MESNGNRMSSGLWTGPHLSVFQSCPKSDWTNVYWFEVFLGNKTLLTPNLESMVSWGSLGSFLRFFVCETTNYLPRQYQSCTYLHLFWQPLAFLPQSMVVTCTSLNSLCCILILWFLFYGHKEVEIWTEIAGRIANTCLH